MAGNQHPQPVIAFIMPSHGHSYDYDIVDDNIYCLIIVSIYVSLLSQ